MEYYIKGYHDIVIMRVSVEKELKVKRVSDGLAIESSRVGSRE